MSPPTRRSLAAIMFTDISGYTALMQEDEGAAVAVRQRHRDVFETEHRHFHGTLIQYYGDGSLSTFNSAVEAVECAIIMQQKYRTGTIVPLRIGIHLGDIVFGNNDVYGDGVNVASRIESLGIPGCVLISDKLRDAVKNQTTINTKSLGYFELKNIADPVEVFAVSNSGIKVPERSELKGKLKEHKKSIAVLPFVNMSADPENEYFSDGIAEEILNGLVGVDSLQVTARTSSFSFKGKNMDVREIGTLLGVSHLLEGSVRKSGNRVRIAAQLVNTIDGYHFFSESYDRTLDDIFEVQDEIARKITSLLREHLGESERLRPLIKMHTQNMQAYETYLRGLFYYNQWGHTGMGNAIPLFQKAIELDRDFALPHARLTVSYVLQTFGGKLSWEDAYRNSAIHIEKIKELRVEIPETSFANAVFEIFCNWNWQGAIDTTRRGLKQFPSFSSLHHVLSTLHYIAGDMNAAIETHKKGLELDPMSVEMIFFMGSAYLWNREFDKAEPYLRRVVEMIPQHRAAWEYIGWNEALRGNYKIALSIFDNLEAEGFRLHRSTCLGWVYSRMGEKQKVETCIQELVELEKTFIGYGLDLATLYTCIGDFDKAFEYLEKVIRNRFGDTMMIRSDVFLAPLKTDPRFCKLEDLIGKMPAIDF